MKNGSTHRWGGRRDSRRFPFNTLTPPLFRLNQDTTWSKLRIATTAYLRNEVSVSVPMGQEVSTRPRGFSVHAQVPAPHEEHHVVHRVRSRQQGRVGRGVLGSVGHCSARKSGDLKHRDKQGSLINFGPATSSSSDHGRPERGGSGLHQLHDSSAKTLVEARRACGRMKGNPVCPFTQFLKRALWERGTRPE